MVLAVPHPRVPLEGDAAYWYRSALGWAVADGSPAQLLTGRDFDVLELPADAGAAVLRRTERTGPVAVQGRRMRLLVAAGSAEELPGLLDWLEWGGVALDLTAVGEGGRMTAPPPPGRDHVRGAARWLRPPGRGSRLPALAGFGDIGHAPDLVRLVDTAATECHRVRLLRVGRARVQRTETQPLAFS
ncbi:SCO3374 family protein [Streptomyces sp. NPDC015127]|uniref:SCO3374 family protein n=1 Tax=Streptomyces sp. NPDC015127 TaxID=3364939 RepID=UPI0036F89014